MKSVSSPPLCTYVVAWFNKKDLVVEAEHYKIQIFSLGECLEIIEKLLNDPIGGLLGMKLVKLGWFPPII